VTIVRGNVGGMRRPFVPSIAFDAPPITTNTGVAF
jgi:hypothetical protein